MNINTKIQTADNIKAFALSDGKNRPINAGRIRNDIKAAENTKNVNIGRKVID